MIPGTTAAHPQKVKGKNSFKSTFLSFVSQRYKGPAKDTRVIKYFEFKVLPAVRYQHQTRDVWLVRANATFMLDRDTPTPYNPADPGHPPRKGLGRDNHR